MISENLKIIEEKIAKACINCGRAREDVTLICVSKTKPVSMVCEAYEAGQRQFGENKVQEIVLKAPEMPSDTIWHMIGHLQKNKVKKAVGLSEMIHSVDSYELAELIDKEAEKAGKLQKILLEVNIASENSKYGIAPCDVVELADKLSGFNNIIISGLMCVAPYTEDAENNRIYFKQMKELLNNINNLNNKNINGKFLSMGMSGDFEVAIEEGATHIRVGTSIFGERNYTK